MITLEVHQTGQAPRTYRFNNANMTIGFTPQATLPLEPFAISAPSVEIVSETGSAVQAKPHDSTPATHFKVNDEPCLTPRPLLNGDRLSVNGYAITILGLPGSAAKAPAAATPPAKAASPAPGSGASGRRTRVRPVDGDAAPPSTPGVPRSAAASAASRSARGAARSDRLSSGSTPGWRART
ncbi:MAG: hypothetical protein WCG36_08455, partial [bacterium]